MMFKVVLSASLACPSWLRFIPPWKSLSLSCPVRLLLLSVRDYGRDSHLVLPSLARCCAGSFTAPFTSWYPTWHGVSAPPWSSWPPQHTVEWLLAAWTWRCWDMKVRCWQHGWASVKWRPALDVVLFRCGRDRDAWVVLPRSGILVIGRTTRGCEARPCSLHHCPGDVSRWWWWSLEPSPVNRSG